MSRIATHSNIHNAKTVQASNKTGVPGGIRLTFCTDNDMDGYVEYVVFLDDQVLAERLAKAINEIVAARNVEIEQIASKDEPANEYVRDDAQFGVGA